VPEPVEDTKEVPWVDVKPPELVIAPLEIVPPNEALPDSVILNVSCCEPEESVCSI